MLRRRCRRRAGAAAARVNGVARARRRPRIGGGRRLRLRTAAEPEPERPRAAAAAAGCGARLGRRRVFDLIVDEETFCIRPAVMADAHWPATKAESAVSDSLNLPMLSTKASSPRACLSSSVPASSVRSCLSVAHVRSVKTSSFERPSSAKIRLGRESAPDDGSEACSAPTPTFDVGAAARIVSQPLITAGGGGRSLVARAQSSRRQRGHEARDEARDRGGVGGERADSASDVSFSPSSPRSSRSEPAASPSPSRTPRSARAAGCRRRRRRATARAAPPRG